MGRGRHPKDPAITESNAIALRVSLVLLACGIVWLLVTDLVIYEIVHDEVLFGRIETIMDWIFVGFAVAVLYVTVRHTVQKLARSNATFQAVVTSVSDGLFLLDQNGAISYVNPAAAHILDAEPSALLGLDGPAFARRYHVALPDGRLVEPTNYVSQRALTGENPRPYKAILHPPGRPEIFVMVTGAPVRPVPDGPPALSVSIMRDVTLEERTQAMRDAFVSSAAHTLKTPVSIINAQLDLLASGTTPSVKASTESIRRQTARVIRLLDNLIVLARIRSQSLRLRPEAVDLANVVTDAAREMENATPDHRLSIHVHTHPMVFADRARLTLVIRNLIDLAYRRALPRTTIDLALEQADHDSGRVSLTYESLLPVVVPVGLAGLDEDAGFAGLGLERYVTEELVASANGSLGSEMAAAQLRRDWFDIPLMEEHTHA
jgi:signal transduction histidine kinase